MIALLIGIWWVAGFVSLLYTSLADVNSETDMIMAVFASMLLGVVGPVALISLLLGKWLWSRR